MIHRNRILLGVAAVLAGVAMMGHPAGCTAGHRHERGGIRMFSMQQLDIRNHFP
jgi:hypothetical protein